MDCTIKIQSPKFLWNMQMTTSGDIITVRITIYIIMPNGGTVSIVFDRSWPSVSDWERDMRMFLNQIMNNKDVIVESHIRGPRDGSETERRIREILCQILGIPDR